MPSPSTGAQGETTHTGHLLLGEHTSAAAAYVAMTRDRRSAASQAQSRGSHVAAHQRRRRKGAFQCRAGTATLDRRRGWYGLGTVS